MTQHTEFSGRSGEALTVREEPDGHISLEVTSRGGGHTFSFNSLEQFADFSRLAAGIASVTPPDREPLPEVRVERDGAKAGEGDSTIRCSKEADIGWLRNRAAELYAEATHRLAQYRNAAALLQWRIGVVEDEQAALARSYFGPDLTGLPAGVRDVLRDLHHAQKDLAKLRAPR